MPSPSGQTPLGSGFTYQGRLELSGTAVNAPADLEFRLFDAATTLAVEAIKEQQSQIESLRQANTGLREQKAAELCDQLANLVNQVTAMGAGTATR